MKISECFRYSKKKGKRGFRNKTLKEDKVDVNYCNYNKYNITRSFIFKKIRSYIF